MSIEYELVGGPLDGKTHVDKYDARAIRFPVLRGFVAPEWEHDSGARFGTFVYRCETEDDVKNRVMRFQGEMPHGDGAR